MKIIPFFKNPLRIILAGAALLAMLAPAAAVSAQSACGATYTVKLGDYMTKIAVMCGVSYTDLRAANPQVANPSLIFTGQVLNIPGGTAPATGGQPGGYAVKTGDTLFAIGQRFNLTPTDLHEANKGLGATLTAGQVLNIPARLQFAAGGTAASVQAHLVANNSHYYLLNAGAGRTLEATLSAAAGVSLAIYGADGSTLLSPGASQGFRGVLPKTQDTILVVSAGGSAVDYGLSVDIPQRIGFAAGSTSAALTGTVPAALSQYFILRAANGQTLNVTATPDAALQLIVYGVDGSVLRSGMGQGASFSGVLPSTQDYILVLRSANVVQPFTLKVSIPAAPPVTVSGSPSVTVAAGDTLFSIAARFQTTVAALVRANPDIANQNVISVGQVLYLPGATLTLANGQVVYIAKSGDMLNAVAVAFKTTLSALISANPTIGNPNLIFPGQRINIP